MRAVDDFFALEAGGWKGRAGTAARDDEDVRKFLQTAVTDLAGEGKARVARLLLDARPIAAIIVLRSGATAWCWKIAYDERFARFSPGVQLLLDVTQELLDDQSVARADSCADENHPMIDHVWRERLVLADRLIRLGPDGGAAFALAGALEASRRAAIRSVKVAAPSGAAVVWRVNRLDPQAPLIPAKAGIQCLLFAREGLGPRLRGDERRECVTRSRPAGQPRPGQRRIKPTITSMITAPMVALTIDPTNPANGAKPSWRSSHTPMNAPTMPMMMFQRRPKPNPRTI